ncbi:universal stress protein [Kitasatospora fiedleri]|uniref:universal stress protein n=1 Tax=Kitasatospora fiedleri TaxID=2991545 RepID=UPI00249A1D49|nr:universal stress protein [Kitasatospora fiedleri]
METTETRAANGVVAGVDGSVPAAEAAEWAAREAERRGVGLHLVHAVNTGTVTLSPRTGTTVTDLILREAAELLEAVRATLAAAHPGLRITGDVVPREAGDAVLTAAEHASLAVLGTRGHGGFASLLLGSVSLRVAAHATCPVTVVRAAGHSDGPVLVALHDERDTAALRFGCETAARRGLPVRAVHTWSPVVADVGRMAPMVDELGEEARLHEQLLRRTCDPVREEYPGVEVESHQVTGSAAATVVEESRTAALVVLSRHEPAPRFGLRLATPVHAVLHHAHCPVAVVPV